MRAGKVSGVIDRQVIRLTGVRRCRAGRESIMAKHSSDSRGLAVRKRKNVLVDQRKLDAAKIAFGASTETATIDAALDLVVFRTEVFEALDRIAAEALPRYRPPRCGRTISCSHTPRVREGGASSPETRISAAFVPNQGALSRSPISATTALIRPQPKRVRAARSALRLANSRAYHVRHVE